jgi:hypothetical protein
MARCVDILGADSSCSRDRRLRLLSSSCFRQSPMTLFSAQTENAGLFFATDSHRDWG